jgi:hypothetical protein
MFYRFVILKKAFAIPSYRALNSECLKIFLSEKMLHSAFGVSQTVLSFITTIGGLNSICVISKICFKSKGYFCCKRT